MLPPTCWKLPPLLLLGVFAILVTAKLIVSSHQIAETRYACHQWVIVT